MFKNFSGNSRFTGFWGSGGLKEISRPPGAQNGPKTPKSVFSRSWGPFWAKRPPPNFVCMLNADPVNPVWGPMCPRGPRYRRSGGGGLGGHFVGWGPVLFVRDPTDVAHRNRVRVAQLSLCHNVGWFYLSFSRNWRFAGFWRSGGLREISRPVWGPNTPKNAQKWIFPVLQAVVGETPNLIAC